MYERSFEYLCDNFINWFFKKYIGVLFVCLWFKLDIYLLVLYDVVYLYVYVLRDNGGDFVNVNGLLIKKVVENMYFKGII